MSIETAEAARSWELTQYAAKAYKYRHLMLHLARSDLRARFRGSYFGSVWLLINPLVFTAVFSVIFGTIFQVPVREYAPYVLMGVVIWEFFAGMASASTQSILSAEGYLKQARIPLIVFCLRTLIYLFTCFLVGLAAALIVAMLFAPGFSFVMLLWLVPVLVLTAIFTAPIGIISALATTRFRDYQQGISHVLLVLYYLSPVFIVREVFERRELKWFAAVNPVTSLCDLFRDPILYGRTPEFHDVVTIIVWSVVLWAIALYTLSQLEPDTIHYF